MEGVSNTYKCGLFWFFSSYNKQHRMQIPSLFYRRLCITIFKIVSLQMKKKRCFSSHLLQLFKIPSLTVLTGGLVHIVYTVLA